jgi:hypothetical protein
VTVSEWIDQTWASFSEQQRSNVRGILDDLRARQIDADEREAIIDESRRAEATAAQRRGA